MIYEFGLDRSFSEKFEKADILMPFLNYIGGNWIFLEPQIKEYNFFKENNSAIVGGKIIRSDDGSYTYIGTSGEDLFSKEITNKEINTQSFKIETLGEKYASYKTDDYLLAWAQFSTKENIKIILANDKDIYLKAQKLGVNIFRNIIVLYAGIELKLWDINKAKNVYRIWAEDQRAIPPDCLKWENLMSKYGNVLKINTAKLKNIMENINTKKPIIN